MADWVENVLAFASMGGVMAGMLFWIAVATPGT